MIAQSGRTRRKPRHFFYKPETQASDRFWMARVLVGRVGTETVFCMVMVGKALQTVAGSSRSRKWLTSFPYFLSGLNRGYRARIRVH